MFWVCSVCSVHHKLQTPSGSCATFFWLYQGILVHWVPRRSWYNGVWACTAFASFNACPDTNISWLLG